MLAYGNLHRNAISSEHTTPEYFESGAENPDNHTENKVISRGYGFITHTV